MIGFIDKRKLAGLLAAVFVCGVLLSGCGTSKPGGSGSAPSAMVEVNGGGSLPPR